MGVRSPQIRVKEGYKNMYSLFSSPNVNGKKLVNKHVGSKILQWSPLLFCSGELDECYYTTGGDDRTSTMSPRAYSNVCPPPLPPPPLPEPRMGAWVPDLTAFGCVEKNPGPPKTKGGKPPVAIIKPPVRYKPDVKEHKTLTSHHEKPEKKKRTRNEKWRKAGGDAGKWVGDKFADISEQWFDSIFGHGGYTVKHNSFMHTGPPLFTGTDWVTIRHREFIDDIVSSVGFQSSVYDLNPGLSSTFPWLSIVAAGFGMYEFSGVVAELESQSGYISGANTEMGLVAAVTNYDVTDPKFTTMREVLAYQGATFAKPSDSFCHFIECARNKTILSEKYVRDKAVPLGEDPRFFDLGRLEVATEGMQTAGLIVAKLWISYDVRFRLRELFESRTAAFARMSGWMTPGAEPYLSIAFKTDSTLTVDLASTGELTFQRKGRYVVAYSHNTNTTSITSLAALTSVQSAQFPNILHDVSLPRANQSYSSGITGAALAMSTFTSSGGDSNFLVIDIIEPGDGLKFNLSVNSTFVDSYVDIWVMEVGPGFGVPATLTDTPQARLERLEERMEQLALNDDGLSQASDYLCVSESKGPASVPRPRPQVVRSQFARKN